MFAVVRTGGKQYRVAPGDKIVVEKMAGEAGDSVSLGDILLAGDGTDLQDVAGMVVGAEIIAQAKGDKVIVFKKRRRHNYRRKQGHRQKYTILKIVSVGGQTEQKQQADAEVAPAAPVKAKKPKAAAAPSDVGQTPSSEGVAPADAGTIATNDVSTKKVAPDTAAATKTTEA